MWSNQNPALFQIRHIIIKRSVPVLFDLPLQQNFGPCVAQGAGPGYFYERRKGFLRATLPFRRVP